MVATPAAMLLCVFSLAGNNSTLRRWEVGHMRLPGVMLGAAGRLPD
ncbi:hypothetical protein [Arthrobacter sp. HMWF013]|nr:hypothetical protein [Arthrobacter sp. HMWF013]